MNRALVKNAADEKQVKAAGDKEKRGREQELNDVRALMTSREGRRFMYRLINHLCHFDAISATQSGSWTYFQDGERNIGRLIKSDIYEASIDAFHLMEKENFNLKGDTNV